MSKLKELEEYAGTATGQAGKVATLAAAAIREALDGRASDEPEIVGYKNGLPVYREVD